MITKNCSKCRLSKWVPNDFHKAGRKNPDGSPKYSAACKVCRLKNVSGAFPGTPRQQAKTANFGVGSLTHVGILLDSSGSMHSIGPRVLEMANAQLRVLASQSVSGHRVLVTVGRFDGTRRGGDPALWLSRRVQDASYVQALRMSAAGTNVGDYNTDGGDTPLYKATRELIDYMDVVTEKDAAKLVMILTDGADNASGDTRHKIAGDVAARQATDKWTITFMVPRGHSSAIRAVGVPVGNISEWDQTDAGVTQVEQTYRTSTQSYFGARSLGETKVNNFFTADLSKVKQSDLDKLTDISGLIRVLKVDKEANVTDFIQLKNKGHYVIGSAFYQLMKAEKVQSYKAILVKPKGGTAIYGGAEARKLVNLPDYEVKVQPGNLGAYDLFIQSTSPNRILPRGTTVLLNTSHLAPSQPTWVAPVAK